MRIDRLSVGRPVWIPMTRGVRMPGPRHVTVRVRDEGIDVEVDISLDEKGERYLVTAIRGENLTGELLRALRPTEIVREAVLGIMWSPSKNTPAAAKAALDARREMFLKALRGEPLSLDGLDDVGKLETVALLYRLAYLVGQRPTATVAKSLGLSRSRIRQLLQEARGRALLGKTTERKAGV